MGEFSIAHMVILLVILLLFFGPSKLPGLGASIGKAIRGFKSGLNDVDPTKEASRPDQIESPNSTVSDPTKVKDTHKT